MPTPTLPLETRLKSIQAASPNFLAAFEVFTEDFFLALDTAFNAGGFMRTMSGATRIPCRLPS